MRPPFAVRTSDLPVVMTALHAGHDVRPEVAAYLRLDEASRRREEDPYTDRVTRAGGVRVVVHRSRFEVDLNRPASHAVYRGTAWGQEVWVSPPPEGVVERSIAIHADFYRTVGDLLDGLAAAGPFVVLDVHSYNHRRRGPDAPPDDPQANPEVNVGTAGADHQWARLVDRFMADLRSERVAGHGLDVRANVRFQGGHLVRWIHDRYASRGGCALAIELRKSFMDEWTGGLDEGHLRQLTSAIAATVPGLVDELATVHR